MSPGRSANIQKEPMLTCLTARATISTDMSQASTLHISIIEAPFLNDRQVPFVLGTQRARWTTLCSASCIAQDRWALFQSLAACPMRCTMSFHALQMDYMRVSPFLMSSHCLMSIMNLCAS